ncbi:MAG TPA: hypothetical protein VGZ26_08135, partial [Pirellulales bacterium]|nr:hypothetical protein [Pirellulales bacterium]
MYSLKISKSCWGAIAVLSQSAVAWAASAPSESRPATPLQETESPRAKAPAEGSLLEATVAQNRLIAEAIRNDVENELKLARGRIENDPTAVEQY